jgi:predicted site-specific integrase-resolvase
MTKDREIKTAEACKILDITRITLYSWCDRGVIRFSMRPRGKTADRIFTESEIKRVKKLLKPRTGTQSAFPNLPPRPRK